MVNSRRFTPRVWIILLGVFVVALQLVPVPRAKSQEPSGLEAAQALEEVLVDTIAAAEQSVVAVARARKGLGERLLEPDFIPTEFATGVVIDRAGLIVTCYHALGDPERSDYAVWIGRKGYRAEIKAADPVFDLAVLRIAADSLTPIKLGDASKLRKGQIVIALGNPLAIARDGQPSASFGIVSNLHRKSAPEIDPATERGRKDTLHQFGTLIQTDARLERGTSGGALVNLKGEMVGLTSAVAALPGSEEAAGFAIPVNDTFKHAIEQLKLGRTVAYGFLGVAPDDPFHSHSGGVRLINVVSGTPAAQAGLRVGDVVTHVEGEQLFESQELILHVAKFPADKIIKLQLLRDGRPMEVPVRLSKKYQSTVRPAISTEPPPRWRGMVVDFATAHPRFVELSHEADRAGCVAVTDVTPDSSAWKAGLRSGMFISHVGNRRVMSPEEFTRAVEAAGETKTVRLQIASQLSRTPPIDVKP